MWKVGLWDGRPAAASALQPKVKEGHQWQVQISSGCRSGPAPVVLRNTTTKFRQPTLPLRATPHPRPVSSHSKRKTPFSRNKLLVSFGPFPASPHAQIQAACHWLNLIMNDFV